MTTFFKKAMLYLGLGSDEDFLGMDPVRQREQTDEGEIPSLRRRVPTFVERIWNTDYKLPFEDFYSKLDKSDHRLTAIIKNSEQDSLLVGYNILDDGNGLPIRSED